MSGTSPVACSPLALLRCTSLDQTAFLRGGACAYTAPHASGSLAGAVLPKRSASIGCSCTRFPRLRRGPLPAGLRLGAGPFASCHSQGQFYNTEKTRKGSFKYSSKDENMYAFSMHLRMALRCDVRGAPQPRRSPAGNERTLQPEASDRKA